MTPVSPVFLSLHSPLTMSITGTHIHRACQVRHSLQRRRVCLWVKYQMMAYVDCGVQALLKIFKISDCPAIMYCQISLSGGENQR